MSEPAIEDLLRRWDVLKRAREDRGHRKALKKEAKFARVDALKLFLHECVALGREISRTGSRANLQWLAREVGDTLFHETGDYPDAIIKPYRGVPGPSGAPIPSVWNIPHRNPFFYDREDELRRLADGFSGPDGTVLAVSGLGGVGKTQLIIEYAYRHRDSYRVGAWVRAESQHTLGSGMAELARLLDLDGAQSPDVEQMTAAVRDWLVRQDGWLLIFDDANAPELVRPMLPPLIRGHVLISSRAEDFGRVGVARPLILKSWTEECAVDFLLRRTGRGRGDKDEIGAARELAAQLGNFPLALEQVGAYIQAKQCRVCDYLESFKRRSLDLLELGSPGEHEEPVALTWRLCFEQVESHPVAADLFRFSCFVASDKIPNELILLGARHISPVVAEAIQPQGDPLALDDAMVPLTQYSLVTRDPTRQSYSVHALVQLVFRYRLAEDELRRWSEVVVKVLAVALPVYEFQFRQRCEQLLPHAQVAANYVDFYDLKTPEAGHLLHRIGYYLDELVRYHEAERAYSKALAVFEGTGDLTMRYVVLNDLSTLLYSQGRYGEARDILSRGPSPDEAIPDGVRVKFLENLAGVVFGLGETPKARRLYGEARSIREKKLPDEQIDYATLLNNQARVYRDLGDYERAMELNSQAMDIRRRHLSPHHPDVATSLNNMAEVLYHQEKYEEAEDLAKKALKIWEDSQDPDHPDLAIAYNNLAGILHLRGNRDEALDYYRRALAIWEKSLPDDHPTLATVKNNLAGLLRIRNEIGQARTFYEQALATRRKKLGEGHVLVAKTKYSLGLLCHHSESKIEEAVSLYKEALKVFEERLEPDHPLRTAAAEQLESARLLLEQSETP